MLKVSITVPSHIDLAEAFANPPRKNGPDTERGGEDTSRKKKTPELALRGQAGVRPG
jgi:hypothetical protein